MKELEERPKLGMMKEMVALEVCCFEVRDRRMMIKLEVGMWQG